MSSAKEKEILERQRLLAAAMKSKDPAPLLPVPKPAVAVAKSAFQSNTNVKGNQETAPARKKPSSKRPSSALLAAAAAVEKQRVSADMTGTSDHSSNQHLVPAGADDAKPSPQLQRKVSIATTESKPSVLSKLIKHAEDHKGDGVSAQSGMGAVCQPEDFWKNLRNWDVPVYFFEQNQQQKDTKSSNVVVSNPKQLPDTFLNSGHYVSMWAPLCLEECRAQLLQELSQHMTCPILVDVRLTTSRPRSKNAEVEAWSEADATQMYVVVNSKERAAVGSGFKPNDLVLLVQAQHKDILSHISKGVIADKESCAGLALVGHTESSRRELNGLMLKVSKRKWATIGKQEMYLIRIGSNVTAMREFHALCDIENLPMKHFILGKHLEQEQNRRKLSRHQPVEQLLQRMGGEQLGSGFLRYAERKFNQSQLTAIAASAHEYGDGGFTLIKGPPGTGKTTTLVAVLNSLHIRQYNKYYDEVRRIATKPTGSRGRALDVARRSKPRLLVCAPSNAAIDNIILKIMEDGFVDGKGQRYNPLMVRVGVHQSVAVRDVSLMSKVDALFAEQSDPQQIQAAIDGYKGEVSRITGEIARLRHRLTAIAEACPWQLSQDWEIRIDEEGFETHKKAYFVNHRTKQTTYEQPPPAAPNEKSFKSTSMPSYQDLIGRIVKLVDAYYSVKSHLERCIILKQFVEAGSNREMGTRLELEDHVLGAAHLVMTTLGSAGSTSLINSEKFEVVVVDEAAQSVELAALSALKLGSKHVVLVGDPQQLPATIFNVSGRNSKYDRSLFQRLEEAGQPVYMLNEQYRMHPKISHFPRNIFYQGALLDGPNVKDPAYGNPLVSTVQSAVPTFSPFVMLDLDSQETRSGGPSLSNASEAQLAVYLVEQLRLMTGGASSSLAGRIAVISPYAEQCKLLHRSFERALGPRYESVVEVNTVDAFQGREANIVIFSAVRAAGSHGIGFLADVRRMNVALTRAKFFLFVIARCQSIVVNPYWSDLVKHAQETGAVLKVPMVGRGARSSFGHPRSWKLDVPAGYVAGAQPDPAATQQAPEQIPENPNGAATRTRPSDPRKKSDRRKPVEGQDDTKMPASQRIPEDPRKKRGYANTSMDPSDSRVTTKSTAETQNILPTDPRKRRK